MDLPGKNQRFDIDDLRHPSHYPDPNTNLLAPIRPRMPQFPIYKKYNAKTPENDFQAATPPQEKAIQVRPEVGPCDKNDSSAPPPPRRETTNADECPRLLPREGNILPDAIVPYSPDNVALVNTQDSALKSTSEGEKVYHEAFK